MQETFEETHKRWQTIMREVKQWTWAVWDNREWKVLHQIPDPHYEYRVISTMIAHGDWTGAQIMKLPYIGQGNYEVDYRAKQMEIGSPYATKEWPLMLMGGHHAPIEYA